LTEKEGLAMGASSSSLIAEMFLKHTEHQHMPQLSAKHKIINYFRYVDDILIIFNPNHTKIQSILADTLQFTAEAEKNAINYLDVNIHRTPSGCKTAVHRKPTSTDSIIPHPSNHPP
jgi:hypothetical protein